MTKEECIGLLKRYAEYNGMGIPNLWWVPTGYAVIAAIATLRAGLWSWCFWFEMAAYLAIFTTMSLIIA